MKNKNLYILIGSILLFSFVSLWVISGKSASFDLQVYLLLHQLPEEIMKPFFLFITNFGNTSVCIVLVLLLTLIFYKTHGKFILLSSIIDVSLNQGLKYIFRRERPSLKHLVEASGYSFPSGHTMISVMLYGFLLYLSRRYIKNEMLKNILSILFVFFIIFIPMSRIYVGVHYPTDILAGYIVGACALYFVICWHKKVME